MPEVQYSNVHLERDLQSLISSNPEIIGSLVCDDSECDIRSLKREVRLPSGGRLDLLLLASTGKLFLVEFKRDMGYRDAIAQLLDYASDIQNMTFNELMRILEMDVETPEQLYASLFGDADEDTIQSFTETFLNSLTSPYGIGMLLVSYSAGEDTKRIVNWLRKVGIDINIIEFDYFTEGEIEILAPRLIIDDSATEDSNKPKTLSESERIYFEFFRDVLSMFKEKKPGVTERQARPNRWLEIPLGHTGIHLEWKILGSKNSKQVRVALILDMKSQGSEQLKQALIQRKDAITSALKKKLPEDQIRWDETSSARALNLIYTEREAGPLSSLTSNDAIKNWAVEAMIAFYDVLKREIDSLTKA
ncbi:MAG: DUF4268 domain-containing protein [Thermococcus sp.]|nr:DUF4268 domain-containing protein [Thermococcus sp.]